ncbi:putative MAPEG superfamily protein [Litorivivens lipolytica]|uniref:Putative MAPEG superfamily protein n=1 Tax=Litorivivens lipolytica TaxID=1524264 RepID=A0A7W4W6I0_9GAMM|nr:MAPEG family protein [Litorivivens lipolytica]MBB3048339.1 putative MAPEG superfamily protein [Litorivivens lipolytica]
MTTALWCLMITALIPTLLSFIGGFLRHKELGGADNKNPRQQYAQATGVVSRAFAAQQNAWEGLMLFTAALVAAFVSGVPQEQLATVSIVFVVARVLHAVFYLADRDALRSLSYLVALGSVICIFIMGA